MSLNGQYSLWISTVPADNTGYVADSNFMFIGSASTLPLTISYTSSTVGVLGQDTSTAVFVDGTAGAVMQIALTSTRVNPSDADDDHPNTYSNKAFIEAIIAMRTAIQMTQNAYVLRMYNLTTMQKSDYDNLTPLEIIEKRTELQISPKSYNVFINSIDITLDIDSPNSIDVSLNLIQRNLLLGYNT